MCANVLSIYSLASRTFHDTVFWLPCVFLQVAGCHGPLPNLAIKVALLVHPVFTSPTTHGQVVIVVKTTRFHSSFFVVIIVYICVNDL